METGGFSKKSFFITIYRRSLTQMFFKTGVIRNFAILYQFFDDFSDRKYEMIFWDYVVNLAMPDSIVWKII